MSSERERMVVINPVKFDESMFRGVLFKDMSKAQLLEAMHEMYLIVTGYQDRLKLLKRIQSLEGMVMTKKKSKPRKPKGY